MASEPTLSSLAQLAASTARDASSTEGSDGPLKTKEQLRRYYLRTLYKVVSESDVVVLVLDARDPEGCRSRLLEEEVRRREGEGKKLVFVLNKIDLVPRANAEAWLNTAPALLRLLKAYKPSASQSVTVGVVGYPNVGKSSLINTLKRAKVCAVASQPGHTKELQHVQLERGLRIVDSPGVIFDDEDPSSSRNQQVGVLLRNVVKVEYIEDPISVVEQILARTEKEKIMKIYNLPEFTSVLEFLTMLALNTGRLLKGGTPDILAAARVVLADWNHQKIPFFTVPPTIHPSLVPSTLPGSSDQVAPGAEATGQAQILTEFGKPFTLEGLFGDADAAMDQDAMDGGGFVPDAEDSMQIEGDVDDGTMKIDEETPFISNASRKRARSPSPEPIQPPLNSLDTRAPKRMRKAAARNASSPALAVVASRRAARMDRKKQGKNARRLAAKVKEVMEVDDGA